MSDENGGSKSGKAITGCGGCGCLLALLMLCSGGVMIGWGSTDSAVTELIMPGYATFGASTFVGFIALVVLIIGIVMGKKKG